MNERNTENIENADYAGAGGYADNDGLPTGCDLNESDLPECDLTEGGSISGGANGSAKPKKKRGKHSATFMSAMRGLVTGVVLLAVFFAGYLTNYFSVDADLRSLQFVYNTYRDNYFFCDGTENPAKTLTEGLMDIYSEYYTADEYNAEQNASKGRRKGYGISFDGLTVFRVSGNSPAEKAGLKKGGRILAFKLNDGEFVSVEKQAELTSVLSAAKDSDKVILRVDYDGDVKDFSMYKADYRESYVYYTDSTGCYRFNDGGGKMELNRFADCDITLNDNFGYIKYVSFYGQSNDSFGSVAQITTALDKMLANGKTNLIIDLRDNGGGFMDIMCKLSGIFCPLPGGKTGDVAQIAEYRGSKKYSFKIDYSAAKNADREYYSAKIKKIVFLANKNSASASEALMGAVLDYDSAARTDKVRVVLESHVNDKGETIFKSYGKGIMQTTFVNKFSGEALKLTTARIVWPLSGTCIHGVGITTETDPRVFNAVGEIIGFAQTI